MSEEQPPPGFKRAYSRATRIVNDSQKAARLVRAARDKANRKRGRILQMKEELESLFRMVSAWARGDYKKVPVRTIAFAISAIVYFLNPFDLVHDYLPVAGYLDDATILTFVLNSISDDVREFLIWEKHTKT